MDGIYLNHEIFNFVKLGRLDKLIQALSDGQDIHRVNIHGESLLHTASFNGQLECLNYLLANGLDINRIDKQGNAPLYYAAQLGYLECVQFLIEKGADCLIEGNYGSTALGTAKLNRKHDVSEYIENYLQAKAEQDSLSSLIDGGHSMKEGIVF